jgi:hypothetical protein
MELTAARAETWNDAKQTILSDARFTEYDQAGAPATEGEARRVVFHSDTENAEVSGGVQVRSNPRRGTSPREASPGTGPRQLRARRRMSSVEERRRHIDRDRFWGLQ